MFIKKNCWSGSIKNNNFNISYVAFSFKKQRKTSGHYHYFKPVCQKYPYDLQFLRYRMTWTEMVILSHFSLFYSTNNPKNQNFEKIKKIAGDIIILLMCTKNLNHDVWFLRYGVRRTEFFVIWGIFCPFTP